MIRVVIISFILGSCSHTLDSKDFYKVDLTANPNNIDCSAKTYFVKEKKTIEEIINGLNKSSKIEKRKFLPMYELILYKNSGEQIEICGSNDFWRLNGKYFKFQKDKNYCITYLTNITYLDSSSLIWLGNQ